MSQSAARADAPAGTLALVFTDIEGSTRLWDAMGADFQPVLAQHDAHIRAAAAAHRGYEVKTEGDAFFLAFDTADDAIGFCLRAQQDLNAAVWPTGLDRHPDCAPQPGLQGLRVRMGVHVGAPICTRDPVTGRADYLGPVVNRAARVGAAARGGQVLVSESALEALGRPLPDGTAVEDLGERTLRGLDRPERLYQLLPQALRARSFPAQAAPPRTNVARPARVLVGRSADLERLDAPFRDGAVAVTLHGPAGVGKSALAAHWAREALPRHPGGVWRIALAGARTIAEATRTVAAVLGVSGPDPHEALCAALPERGRLLLWLDDADFLARELPAWLDTLTCAAPALRVLVTSRTPVSGTARVALAPLDTEDAGVLYLRCAEAAGARPAALADTRAIRALVDELDGVPLAIELAAAHARLLDPSAIRARLAQDLRLARAASGVDPRHQSLDIALGWTWDLLRPADRAALAALAVVEQPVGLADAEFLLAGLPDGFWALSGLLAQGLVHQDAEERLYVPRAARAYVLRQSATDVVEAAERRHADLYGAWGRFERTEALYGADALALHERLARDTPEILRALRRCIDRGDAARAAPLAIAASETLHVRGPAGAALYAYDALLDGPCALPPGRERLMVLRARGWAYSAASELERARRDFERGLADADAQGDAMYGARLCNDLATVRVQSGEAADAERTYAEAIRRAADAGDDGADIAARGNLAMLLRETGRVSESIALLDTAAAAIARTGDTVRGAQVHAVLGMAHTERGDTAAAEHHLTLAIGAARALRDARSESAPRGTRALLRLDTGRPLDALDDARAARRLAEDSGWTAQAALVGAIEARALAATGDADAARRALTRLDAVLLRQQNPLFEAETRCHAVLTRLALGDTAEARAQADALERAAPLHSGILRAQVDEALRRAAHS